jgi:hypothetical protein
VGSVERHRVYSGASVNVCLMTKRTTTEANYTKANLAFNREYEA